MKKALVIVLLGCCARSARAEGAAQAPPPAAVTPVEEQAREAFRSGYAYTERQEWNEALEAFARSAALRPHPLTTFSIAQCEFELGRLARARKAFRRALEERDVGGVALGAEERAHAREYLTEVESKLVRVTLIVGPGFTRLTVDGQSLDHEIVDGRAVHVVGTAAASGDARITQGTYALLADAGEHVFAASSPGRTDVTSRLVLATDHPSVVELLLPPAPPAAAPSTHGAEAPPAAAGTPPLRVAAYTALGIGAAGLATGAVFGVLAITKKSELDESGDCKPAAGGGVECAPSRTGDIEDFHSYADVATVGFVVGGIGAAAGAALLLWGPAPAPARDHARVEPWLGVGSAGVRGTF